MAPASRRWKTMGEHTSAPGNTGETPVPLVIARFHGFRGSRKVIWPPVDVAASRKRFRRPATRWSTKP